MQCPYCGTQNPEAAKFCTECGGSLSVEPEIETPYVPGTQPASGTQPIPGDSNAPHVPGTQPTPGGPKLPNGQTPPPPTSSPSPSTTPTKKGKGLKIAVGIIIGVTVVLVATIIGVVTCSSLMESEGIFGSDKHGVIFRVNIAGGYDEHSSRIPVQITGTDINGNEIDETVFLAYSGVDVELPEGEYEAKVLGSPISSTGTIYKIPEYVAHFTLEGLEPDEEYELLNNQAFPFVAIDPKDLTDEQIEDAIAWARKDEQSGADVGTLQEKIEKSRTEAKS